MTPLKKDRVCRDCAVKQSEADTDFKGCVCRTCYNRRRVKRYWSDPEHRETRLKQAEHFDPDAKRERQREYMYTFRKSPVIPIQLKESGPVILPDWFWYWRRSHMVAPYNKQQVNPSSYDTLLASTLRLQVYRRREYPDTVAELERAPMPGNPHRVLMHYIEPDTGEQRTVDLTMEPFLPGDSVLAHIRERFKVPRFVRLQGMLKSSVAREGADHRAALYVDPAFQGQITLELRFDRSGYLTPDFPIVQFEAQLCLSLKPYRGHYVGDSSTVSNKNPLIAFRALPGGGT